MSKDNSLKEQVYQHITSLIIEGKLEPNQKIDEEKICEELGVSRTPVREALLLLENEGVLLKSPRKGFSLKTLNEKQVGELYCIIGTLEGLAASLACEHLTDAILKEMEFYTLSMDLAINTDNYTMYYKQQLIFHDLFIDNCGNETLIAELHSLKRKLLKYDYTFDDLKEKKKYLLSVNKQHKTILDLFKKKDTSSLREFLEETHWAMDLAVFES